MVKGKEEGLMWRFQGLKPTYLLFSWEVVFNWKFLCIYETKLFILFYFIYWILYLCDNFIYLIPILPHSPFYNDIIQVL